MPCVVQAPREDVYDMRLMLRSVAVQAVLNHVVLITNYICPLNVICRAQHGRGVAHAESSLFQGRLDRWRPVLAPSSGCPGVSCIPKDKGWQAMKGLQHSFTAPASTGITSARMEAAVIGRDGHNTLDAVGLLFRRRARCRSW